MIGVPHWDECAAFVSCDEIREVGDLAAVMLEEMPSWPGYGIRRLPVQVDECQRGARKRPSQCEEMLDELIGVEQQKILDMLKRGIPPRLATRIATLSQASVARSNCIVDGALNELGAL